MMRNATYLTLIFTLEYFYVLTMLNANQQYIKVCPYKWELIGDECFYFSDPTDTKNISQAAAHCESFKPTASLFTPYNETSIAMIKQQFLNKYLSDAAHNGLVHLGITQTINTVTDTEEWYWGSGEQIPTGYWCPGQPGWASKTQPVLSMRRNSSGGVCFHDTGEIDTRPYICHQDVFARCPEGYTPFKGRCFAVSAQSRNFDQAETECNKQPVGHLAAIRSTDDLEFLKKLRGERNHIWLGLTDGQEDHTWMFTDGTALDSIFPIKSDGPTQNCGMLRTEENNLLDDDACHKPKRYICMATAQHVLTTDDDISDIDFNKLLDHNADTCINSEEVLMNRNHYRLNMMTSPTPDGATISVMFNRNVKCSKRPVLFASAVGKDCDSLHPCRLMTGRDVTSTSCLYRCPCDEEDECHVILLDLKKQYKQEPADICDVMNVI